MDPEAEAALEEFVVYLRHQRQFADYMFVSAAALVVYDYLLNLSREIALICCSLPPASPAGSWDDEGDLSLDFSRRYVDHDRINNHLRTCSHDSDMGDLAPR